MTHPCFAWRACHTTARRLASRHCIRRLWVQVEAACHAAAAQLGCPPADRSSLQSPFTVLLPPGLQPDEPAAAAAAVSEPAATGWAGPIAAAGAPPGAPPAAAAAAAEEPGLTPPQHTGRPAAEHGSAPGQALAGGGEPSEVPSDATARAAPAQAVALELMLTAPIWRVPPHLVGFRADRPTAKALAKQLAAVLAAV